MRRREGRDEKRKWDDYIIWNNKTLITCCKILILSASKITPKVSSVYIGCTDIESPF